MNEMVKIINERKKEINDLCMELRWVYRGFFTSIYEYVPRKTFLSVVEHFADQLIAYDQDLGEREKLLYKEFLITASVFLKKYCRSADMIFLSLYKIALTVEQSWQDGRKFKESVFWYMFEPHEKDDDNSREFETLKQSFSRFGELYDDAECTKKDFPIHVVLMIDCLLFETEHSYLLDKNYEDGVGKLMEQIGAARYYLQRSLREVEDYE